jgi:hypothetical protein
MTGEKMSRILIALGLGAVMLVASPPSVLANEPKPASKADPARTRAATDRPQAKTVQSPALPPDILQRRRRGIAAMVERNLHYRGMLAGGAAKIVNAKLAGPIERTVTGIFSGAKTTLTLYCATATLVLPTNVAPIAMISVIHPPEGGERMTGTVSMFMPYQCKDADFQPFPEMEQLRVQRRRALGHAD